MIKDFLTDILIEPSNGLPLKLNSKGNLSTSAQSTEYRVIDDVPVVYTNTESVSSEIHSKNHSAFDYVSHYNNDAEYFDYFSKDEFKATRIERERSRGAVISKVPLAAELILDIGCGGAWVAEYFIPKGKRVISVDISLRNPVKALQTVPHENHAALVADAFHLPVKDGVLDVIIASEIIEHVHDPKVFLSALISKLKKGGMIILVTPNDQQIVYNMCVHCNKPTPSDAHLHSFNKNNFNLYMPAGGKLISITSFSNKYLTKTKIYNILNFLPFKAWRFVDRIANKVFGGASILLAVVQK